MLVAKSVQDLAQSVKRIPYFKTKTMLKGSAPQRCFTIRSVTFYSLRSFAETFLDLFSSSEALFYAKKVYLTWYVDGASMGINISVSSRRTPMSAMK